MKNIYQQVKEIRMALGFTQDELARRCGLKQEAISRFEKGEKGATITTLIAIATALGKKLHFTEMAEPYLTAPTHKRE